MAALLELILNQILQAETTDHLGVERAYRREAKYTVNFVFKGESELKIPEAGRFERTPESTRSLRSQRSPVTIRSQSLLGGHEPVGSGLLRSEKSNAM